MELGEVCEINPSKNEVSNLSGKTEVSFVPMEDINIDNEEIALSKRRPICEVFKGYTYFKNEDVLLAKITPCFENGKNGIAKGLLNGIGFGSTEFIILRAKPSKVFPKWIYLNISDDRFREILTPKMTGTAGQKTSTKTSCS